MKNNKTQRITAVDDNCTRMVLWSQLDDLLHFRHQSVWVYADAADRRIGVTGPVDDLEKLVICETLSRTDI